ncbi:uncharacterized protein LOC124279795 [Haliotis rubra]|uniref:uncharacterized protein LOC124279795 n=1 Tax=Haliotis rubra TaxID=36100 RepID=UPI001EE5A8DF|nr:uncharacterized protein LOC124279795 [Haliotis rubra]
MAKINGNIGYTLHGIILALCVINTVLLTFNYGVYKLHHDDFSVFFYNVNLSFYLMKPDIPFKVHVFLLLVGGYIPGVSGLGLIMVNKKMSSNVRLVHLVSAVGGTICMAVLMITEATSIHEIHSVSCGYYWGYCSCGDFYFNTISPAVCVMKQVRITYLALLCINLVCDVISLSFSTKMGKDVPVRHSNITMVAPRSQTTYQS